MSTLWTAASVTATNGSNLITVQSGEDIAAIRTNSWIMVGSAHIMEIKRTFVTDSGVKIIELFDNWEFGPESGQRATVAPSLGEFKTLADDVRRLIQIGEEQINTASVAPEPGSSVKRSENGTVKTAEPQDDDDAVRLLDFAPVKQKGESNEQAISSNSLAILRQRTMAKLERDAVFLAKFTEDRVVKSVGLSKIATSVAEGITISNLDGITGIGPDGRIYDSGVGNVPIVYDPETGECLGVQTAPASTGLLLFSKKFDEPEWVKENATTASGDSISFAAASSFEEAFSGGERIRQPFSGTVGETYSFYFAIPPASQWSDPTARLNVGTAGVSPYVNQIVTPTSDWQYINLTSEALSNPINIIIKADKAVTISGIEMQVNKGYPIPYIPTTDSQVTRGSVECDVPIDGINPSQGYLYFDGAINESETGGLDIFGFGDTGLTTDSITLRSSGSGGVDFLNASGGTIHIDSPSTQITLGERHKILLVYYGTTLKGFIDGVKVYENTTDFVPPTAVSASEILGRWDAGAATHNGTCRLAMRGNYVPTDEESLAVTTLEQ